MDGKEFTVSDYLNNLIADAQQYAPIACDSIIENNATSEITPCTAIEPDLVDATIVDFINFAGRTRGIKVNLCTKDLQPKPLDTAVELCCKCCGAVLEDIDECYDAEKQLCVECDESIIPMVVDYLVENGIDIRTE